MLWSFSICFISFITLFLIALFLVFMGFNFIMNDLVYFIEWEVLSLYSGEVVMTLLFDWMSLILMGLVIFISSLVIFYSEEYMSGDLNTSWFIILVFMFVLSMMCLIISRNLIRILLGWDVLCLLI